MKNNTKGFTLIELLAVIVILAIIALIATPIVLNIIEKARRSAAQDSVYGVMESVKLAYEDNLMDTNGTSKLPFEVKCNGTGCYVTDASHTITSKAIEFGGTKPTAGTFVLNANGIGDTTDIEVNGYHCKIASQTVTCQKDAFGA